MEIANKTLQYPNIRELIDWNYYSDSTIAGCMRVTTELLRAALRGGLATINWTDFLRSYNIKASTKEQRYD